MRITINGNPESLDSPQSIADLLSRFELEPLRVAVEVNEQLVRRASFPSTVVREGDRVEIVTLVGGG